MLSIKKIKKCVASDSQVKKQYHQYIVYMKLFHILEMYRL